MGDFRPERRTRPESFAALVSGAARSPRTRARLLAWLAGGIPFGATRDGDLVVYMLGEPSSTLRDVVAVVSTKDWRTPPSIICRTIAEFALLCALEESAYDESLLAVAERARSTLRPVGVAEHEAVRVAFERAGSVVDLLCGTTSARTRSIARLGLRPLDIPPPEPRTKARVGHDERKRGLALGPLVEAFFRYEEGAFVEISATHEESADAIVREAATLFARTVGETGRMPTKLGADLLARRARTLRKKEGARPRPVTSASRLALTRRIVEEVDKAARSPLPSTSRREEALIALAELGDSEVADLLVERAIAGDVDAVDMLGALRNPNVAPHLLGLLGGERDGTNARKIDVAVVRALGAIGHGLVSSALRKLLVESPMTTWREGIARADLVGELVLALGTLRDEEAGPALKTVLEGQTQEYRALAPTAAWALGRVAHLPALPTLVDRLTSAKGVATSEAVWAVGEIGARHPEAREQVTTVLSSLRDLDPAAEVVRLAGLTKCSMPSGSSPSLQALREAFHRALWEPSFRREETAKRQLWALRAFAELHASRDERLAHDLETLVETVLDHEAMRYFLTLDEHRVRAEAEQTFATWRLAVPTTRKYFAVLLEDLERQGGLDALHDALRDPFGVFRHNVATYLSAKGDLASVGPLAEATSRLFAEPMTSTYEYDDAPAHLVAFVQALARFNRPEGNEVLIEGLRTGHHHVRAVVAENAPDDPRFIPELMAMLGDPRSFLRSRAERSLVALGVRRSSSDMPPLTIDG